MNPLNPFGFDSPKKSNNINDGILTASEVSQLNLNAKLVILSACNTAARQNEYAAVFLD